MKYLIFDLIEIGEPAHLRQADLWGRSDSTGVESDNADRAVLRLIAPPPIATLPNLRTAT